MVDVRHREDAESPVAISLNGAANPPHNGDKTGSLAVLKQSNAQPLVRESSQNTVGGFVRRVIALERPLKTSSTGITRSPW